MNIGIVTQDIGFQSSSMGREKRTANLTYTTMFFPTRIHSGKTINRYTDE